MKSNSTLPQRLTQPYVHGQRFAIYIPNKDRNGAPVPQSAWINKALQLLSRAGGGATAMPPVTGA